MQTTDEGHNSNGQFDLSLDPVQWGALFEQNLQLKLSQLLLRKMDPWAAMTKPDATARNAFVFNTELRGINGATGAWPSPVPDQKQTGTCWAFTPLNLLRYKMATKLNVTTFQLSSGYLIFYDKLEKANFYLTTILKNIQTPLPADVLRHLHSDPLPEGGQISTAGDLLAKYGCVPLPCFPLSWSGEQPEKMRRIIRYKLRDFACELEAMAESGSTKKRLETRKNEMLGGIYNILSICLGRPPTPDETCCWDYVDADGKACNLTFTPKKFYQDNAESYRIEEYVSLVDDPRHPCGKVLEVAYKNTTGGGQPVRYVNAPVDVLEKVVIECIKADIPVMFGMDDMADYVDGQGIWDDTAHDTELAMGISMNMDKADRLRKFQTCTNHSLLITAVHIEDGRPVRYKLENSWAGTTNPNGWSMCTASWFRKHGLQVSVPKEFVPTEYLRTLEADTPVVLSVWDPLF